MAKKRAKLRVWEDKYDIVERDNRGLLERIRDSLRLRKEKREDSKK